MDVGNFEELCVYVDRAKYFLANPRLSLYSFNRCDIPRSAQTSITRTHVSVGGILVMLHC